jgi:hypothetical protein
MRRGKLVIDMFGPSIEGPADEIVTSAWEADTPAKRVKLARKALAIDLNAIDAYNILGIHAETLGEKIALFRQADAIGEELFASLLDDEEMAWWGFIGTRPWMRARHNFGLALLEAQDFGGATTVLKSLIALNPNDNQGVRYVLLRIFAETGNDTDCRVLFDLFPDDGSIEFPSTKLLVELAKAKPRKVPEQMLADITASNPHFLSGLKRAATTGKWPPRPTAEMIAFGSKQQANLCLSEFRGAWTRTPRILERFLAIPSIASLEAT